MPKPTAMLRVSDVEPLRSILPMFDAAGWDYVLPDRQLRNALRDMGCRNVDEIPDMVRRWGAEYAPPHIKEVGLDYMANCTLYVDVNGNFNGPRVWDRWKHLKDRVLTYFINGGEPRNVPDKGDCQTPTTPMMTTAQHYKSTLFCPNTHWNKEAFSCDGPPNPRGYWTNRSLSYPPLQDDGTYTCPHGCGPLIRAPWLGKVYVFYPAFTRMDRIQPRITIGYTPPVSFVHNSMSWGGQAWYADWAKPLGVKSYGGGNSPDGLIAHEQCFDILRTALCTVYMKSGGAVDYSILEPMAMGCPTTFHSSYVHNCRLYELLEPGVTCLAWDSAEEIKQCIESLRDPVYNRKIGEAGRQRMVEVTWNLKRDAEGFCDFMRRNFGE